MRAYKPQKIRAPIVLFLANEVQVNDTVLTDRRLGWRDFARRGFEAVRVPGDHLSMLSEVNAPVLASQLRQALHTHNAIQASAEVSA